MRDSGIWCTQCLIIGHLGAMIRVETSRAVRHHAGRLFNSDIGCRRSEQICLRRKGRCDKFMKRLPEGNDERILQAARDLALSVN